MKDNIRFSIIIPTYNRASFIGNTIESVLYQTYPHFELIVVDDGSTDNTEEIVRKINSEKVKYVRIKNSERGAARNYGASLAQSDYINFFDSDDLLYPHHLAEAVKLIELNNAPEIFHLGYDIKDDKGKLQRRINKFTGDIRIKLIKEGNLLSCNGVFVRTDVMKNNLFNEDRRLSGSEDHELWLRLASKYYIYYSNVITSSILNHDERSVLMMKKEELIERFSLIVETLLNNPDFVLKFGSHKSLLMANSYSYISLHIALTGKNKTDVLLYLWKSFIKHPQLIGTKRFFAIIKHLILTY